MRRRLMSVLVMLAMLVGSTAAFDTTKIPESPSGTKAVIDLPITQHMLNTGGSDGYGLCVPTSVTVAARWQNLPEMYGFRKFTEGRPGGSDPSQLASDLQVYAKRNAIDLPPYVQHTGGDDAFLDLIVQTRRMGCITYAGLDGFYDSGIAHMVDLAHLDKSLGAIIDNNRPGNWIWMNRKQALNRWKGLDDAGKPILVPVRDWGSMRVVWMPVGGGWAFAWLAPPPPPLAPGVAPGLGPPLKVIPPALVWERTVLDDWVFQCLYVDGVLAWVVDPDGRWHKANGPFSWEDHGTKDQPPETPAPDAFEPTKDFNNGNNFWKVSPDSHYWVSGVEVSRAKAYAALANPVAGLVDDSDKYHLSVIGDRKTVLGWFAAGGPLEQYSRRVHVQVYARGDWPAIERLHTAVTLQEPAKLGGRVVGTCSSATVSLDSVKRCLAEVFDAPAPKPIPPSPAIPAEPEPIVTPAAGLAWPYWLAFGLLTFVLVRK